MSSMIVKAVERSLAEALLESRVWLTSGIDFFDPSVICRRDVCLRELESMRRLRLLPFRSRIDFFLALEASIELLVKLSSAPKLPLAKLGALGFVSELVWFVFKSLRPLVSDLLGLALRLRDLGPLVPTLAVLRRWAFFMLFKLGKSSASVDIPVLRNSLALPFLCNPEAVGPANELDLKSLRLVDFLSPLGFSLVGGGPVRDSDPFPSLRRLLLPLLLLLLLLLFPLEPTVPSREPLRPLLRLLLCLPGLRRSPFEPAVEPSNPADSPSLSPAMIPSATGEGFPCVAALLSVRLEVPCSDRCLFLLLLSRGVAVVATAVIVAVMVEFRALTLKTKAKTILTAARLKRHPLGHS